MEHYDRIKYAMDQMGMEIEPIEFGKLEMTNLFGFENELWIKTAINGSSIDTKRTRKFKDDELVDLLLTGKPAIKCKRGGA